MWCEFIPDLWVWEAGMQPGQRWDGAGTDSGAPRLSCAPAPHCVDVERCRGGSGTAAELWGQGIDYLGLLLPWAFGLEGGDG